MTLSVRGAVAIICALTAVSWTAAQSPPPRPNQELESLQAHFEMVIKRRHEQLFKGITTIQQWEQRKRQTRAALQRMLWHDLLWPDRPPRATVTGRQNYAAYTVENLVLETVPGIFLTANLYLPRGAAKPVPVLLYQCGHANKSLFRRHGAWFASNGMAMLVMDNIEMGEIEFTHHGVYSNAWFHWYSRGFSPLAVELLNARRAIDYLVTRPDLDPSRIGATGRSGGGMTTFFLAALDDRIVASAPVSGTLSTKGWIEQRLSMAHCDCQYPVNSHGLLYSEIGALIAPRVQLLVNADADRGFPMDAFTEMVDKIGEVYRLYKKNDALRTAVAPGGHADTEAIRLPVYSFFLKEFLGKDDDDDDGRAGRRAAARNADLFPGRPADRRAADANRRNADPAHAAASSAEASTPDLDDLRTVLREEVFRYHPATAAPLQPEWGEESIAQGRRIRRVSFTTFEGLRAKAVYSLPAARTGSRLPALLLVDHRKGIPVWGNEQPLERNQWADRAVLTVETLDRGSRALEQNLRSFTRRRPAASHEAPGHGRRHDARIHAGVRGAAIARVVTVPAGRGRGQDHDPRQRSRWRERHVRGAARREGGPCRSALATGIAPARASLSRRASAY